jgi:hypothetical protein
MLFFKKSKGTVPFDFLIVAQKSKGTVPFDFLIVAQIKSPPEGKAFQ